MTVPWPWRHAVQRCGSVWRCWKTVCKSSVTNWRWKRDRQLVFLGLEKILWNFFEFPWPKGWAVSKIFERERQGPWVARTLVKSCLPPGEGSIGWTTQSSKSGSYSCELGKPSWLWTATGRRMGIRMGDFWGPLGLSFLVEPTNGVQDSPPRQRLSVRDPPGRSCVPSRRRSWVDWASWMMSHAMDGSRSFNDSCPMLRLNVAQPVDWGDCWVEAGGTVERLDMVMVRLGRTWALRNWGGSKIGVYGSRTCYVEGLDVNVSNLAKRL